MKTLMVVVMMTLIACPGLSLGDEAKQGGSANEATTVKSGKSNTSDRVGTTGGEQGAGQGTGQAQPATGQPQQAPKVKGSKSNTSE